jgi:hypothetical protein
MADNHHQNGGATAPVIESPSAVHGGEGGIKQRKATVADWSTSKLKRTLRMANLCNGR